MPGTGSHSRRAGGASNSGGEFYFNNEQMAWGNDDGPRGIVRVGGTRGTLTQANAPERVIGKAEWRLWGCVDLEVKKV